MNAISDIQINPTVEGLKQQFQEGEITEKYLQKAYECGKLSDTELMYILMTDEKIIALHDPDNERAKENGFNKWWQGNDGRFRIKLDGKLIAKKYKCDLEKEILVYHKKQYEVKDVPTISEAFDKYIEERKAMCSIRTFATEKKYQNDFKRFFEKDEEHFSDSKIDSVTKEDISIFFRRTIERLQLNKKAFSALYDYTRGLFEYLFDEEIIPSNPCSRVKKGTFASLCHEKDVAETCLGKLASDEDIKRMLEKIEKTKQDNPQDLVPYAYNLCVFYGMRPSEPCGLKWTDLIRTISGKEVLCIQRRVVEDLKKGKDNILICNPKGNKARLIPVTPTMRRLLDEVIAVKERYGIESEWIFGVGDKPMCPNRIENYGRDRKGGKNHLTPYKMRKTINSNLKDRYSMTTEQTSSLLGNSKQVNNTHYTYETGFMDEKMDALEKEQRRMMSLVEDEKDDLDENNSLSER